MRITVTAKPYSRTSGIEEVNPTTFIVRVDAPAEGGKANARLVVLLAEHFGVPNSAVRIVSGMTGRQKVVEIIGK